MSNEIIQGLWIGKRLSVMEQLSIRSFLAHGHSYHLYTYDDVGGVPPGTVLRDAREILPAERIFRYAAYDTYAGFSNLFRYKLLLDRGGWWADSDTVCLQPFDFDADYVISSENNHVSTDMVNVGVMKAPPGSSLFAYAWETCNAKDPGLLEWGEIGPRLAGAGVAKFGFQSFVEKSAVFCPIDYADWETVLDGERQWSFGPETYAVHLWNELWRRAGRDKDAMYPKQCLYERLKQQYGLAPWTYSRWLRRIGEKLQLIPV